MISIDSSCLFVMSGAKLSILGILTFLLVDFPLRIGTLGPGALLIVYMSDEVHGELWIDPFWRAFTMDLSEGYPSLRINNSAASWDFDGEDCILRYEWVFGWTISFGTLQMYKLFTFLKNSWTSSINVTLKTLPINSTRHSFWICDNERRLAVAWSGT